MKEEGCPVIFLHGQPSLVFISLRYQTLTLKETVITVIAITAMDFP